MNARTLLPSANSRPLLAVVLMLVALCAAQAVYWLIDLLSQPYWGAFIMAAAWSLLGVGLWRLHPAARWISVILLWMLIVVLIGGVINPFTAGDLMAERGTAPSVWILVAWITPAIAVSLAILHILGKYKGEFGRKGGALQGMVRANSEATPTGVGPTQRIEAVATEPWQFRAVLYFICALQLMMATYEITRGTLFTVAVGVMILVGTVGLFRRLEWGRAFSLIFMWLVMLFGVTLVMPFQIEIDQKLGVESPTTSVVVTQLIVLCSLALGSLHFLGKNKSRFRSA